MGYQTPAINFQAIVGEEAVGVTLATQAGALRLDEANFEDFLVFADAVQKARAELRGEPDKGSIAVVV